MTSEAPTECFVYITLPGQTEPVTAGRFALTTDRRGTPEGRFSLESARDGIVQEPPRRADARLLSLGRLSRLSMCGLRTKSL